jgi:tetratricopeptide (TPR) repeat protein
MDDVYEAVDRATGARVALKATRAGSDAVAWARFERGVRLARRLDHPRVLGVLASGRDAARGPWMTMTLLAGETLDARARRRPLDPDEVVTVARQVCEALEHAHGRGVVHRDLKPQNVWLRGDLDACVFDFGVARALDEVALTEGAAAVGTVAYMAPEQVRGGAVPDPRSDLWALGVILFECLTGRQPFQEEGLAATLYAILSRPVPDLRRRGGVPPALAEVVHALLARDPAARPVDARAVRAWLDEATRDGVTGAERDRWLDAVADAGAAEAPSELWEVVRRALGASSVRAATPSPFVGRDLERDLLLDGVARAEREQRPTVVVVLGGDAMGRSRLCAEAAAIAWGRPEVTVVAGRCVAEQAAAPFAALDASLGVALSAAVGDEPQAAIDGARARLRAALAARCEAGPVVLSLDDAHHLDPPSRAALAWVAAHCDDLPVALWLFAHEEARAALDALSHAQVTRSLGPLDASSARALLRHCLPDAPAGDLDTLVGRADGNPFVLEELARMYRDEGGGAEALPVSVEALLQARLYRLGRAARRLLKRAAVFGRQAWVEGVEALGADAAALPSLREAGLVALKARSRLAGCREFVVHGGSLLDVAYALWPEGRRAELHARAAAWLDGREGALPIELARHWDLAGDPRRAAGGYARAAAASARAGDAATATACVARVLALTDDDAVRWQALAAQDEALQIDGSPTARAAGLDALEALAPRIGLDAMAEAAWRRCYHARITRDRAAALHHGALAIDLAEGASPRLAALAHMELSLLAANEGRFADARAHAERASAAARLAGDAGVGARAAATRGYVLSESGDDAGACALLDAAAEGYRALGDVRREAIQRGNLGFLQLRLGRFDDARASVDAAIVGAARVGNAVTLGVGRQNLATLLRALGHHAEARRELDLADRLARDAGFSRLAEAVAVERCLLALARRAPPEELLACAARASAAAATSRVPQTVASCRAAALRCLAAAGARDEALRAAVTAARASAELPPEARLELRLAELAGAGVSDAAGVRGLIADCARPAGAEAAAAARSVTLRLVVPEDALRVEGHGG